MPPHPASPVRRLRCDLPTCEIPKPSNAFTVQTTLVSAAAPNNIFFPPGAVPVLIFCDARGPFATPQGLTADCRNFRSHINWLSIDQTRRFIATCSANALRHSWDTSRPSTGRRTGDLFYRRFTSQRSGTNRRYNPTPSLRDRQTLQRAQLTWRRRHQRNDILRNSGITENLPLIIIRI